MGKWNVPEWWRLAEVAETQGGVKPFCFFKWLVNLLPPIIHPPQNSRPYDQGLLIIVVYLSKGGYETLVSERGMLGRG